GVLKTRKLLRIRAARNGQKAEIAVRMYTACTRSFQKLASADGKHFLLVGFSPPLLRTGPARCGQIILVKRLPNYGLDYRLAANVQLLCSVVQFVQHLRSEVYIHPLDRAHHASRVCEKPRDILSLFRKTRNALGRHRLPFMSSLHRAVAPA